MPSRVRDGLLLAGAVLAVLAVSWVFWLPRSPAPAPDPAVAATATARCADAVARVQQYQPPGQQRPLREMLVLQVRAAEPGGYQPVGWRWEREAGAGRCRVQWQYQARNTTTTLTWTYAPATGQVEAADDRTRQLSGW